MTSGTARRVSTWNSGLLSASDALNDFRLSIINCKYTYTHHDRTVPTSCITFVNLKYRIKSILLRRQVINNNDKRLFGFTLLLNSFCRRKCNSISNICNILFSIFAERNPTNSVSIPRNSCAECAGFPVQRRSVKQIHREPKKLVYTIFATTLSNVHHL